jgi:hypothetical protein
MESSQPRASVAHSCEINIQLQNLDHILAPDYVPWWRSRSTKDGPIKSAETIAGKLPGCTLNNEVALE